jgi:hypothetical protein
VISRMIQYIISLLVPRLAREVALDLEADALGRRVDRLAQLHEKAEQLRAAGHGALADELLQQAGTISADNAGLFTALLPGLPDFSSGPGVVVSALPVSPPKPGPPAPAASQNPSRKLPPSRPAKTPAPTADRLSLASGN